MKIHIDIKHNISPAIALECVKQVIEVGKVSANGKSYCYATTFKDNIFPHHPEWDWYQRLPVYNIYTDKADHGTKCFYIRWMSLETSSISYIKCIKNIKNTRQ